MKLESSPKDGTKKFDNVTLVKKDGQYYFQDEKGFLHRFGDKSIPGIINHIYEIETGRSYIQMGFKEPTEDYYKNE